MHDSQPEQPPDGSRPARPLPLRLAARLARRIPAERRERIVAELADRPAVIERVVARDDAATRMAALDEATIERLVDHLVHDRADTDGAAALIRAVTHHIRFEEWERHGWHVIPAGPSSPVPDTGALPDRLWERPAELPGLDLREDAQLALVEDLAARWAGELTAIPRDFEGPGRFFTGNASFGPVDAELAWGLVRSGRPRRVLQAGGGWSTLLLDEALAANGADGAPGRLILVEPWPRDFLRDAAEASDRIELRTDPVQTLDPAELDALGAGDVLAIDSTHVCRADSDVRHLVLDLLPRLRPGVLVHVQGVHLPDEYPREWLTAEPRRFATEQYLLQAFLAFNAGFEVVWASRFMYHRHRDLLAKLLPGDMGEAGPTSLWLRRAQGRS
jgi:hypothetical protein